MKREVFTTPTLEYFLVNGKTGDSGLYCFLKRTGEAVLFDIGNIENLEQKEISRLTHIFVSHTHLDHFIGFDRMLRVKVPNRCQMRLYGPPGLIDNVVGKLNGYTWNLLEAGQIRFDITELDESGQIRKAVVCNDFNFEPLYYEVLSPFWCQNQYPEKPAAALAILSDGTMVHGVIVDHKTPVVSYSMISPIQYHIRQDQLDTLGLEPGPWISDFQSILVNQTNQECICIQGKNWDIKDLEAKITTKLSGKPIAYLTDLIYNEKNLSALDKILPDTAHLFCESCFMSQDEERAKDKKHLTTIQAARIAHRYRVKKMSNFHYSNIYSGCYDVLENEILVYLQQLENRI